jgi:gluconolactonase
MSRVQLHKFIDLAKPIRTREERHLELSRRGFLSAAAGLAALTSMSKDAFARNFGPDAPPIRYPDPDVVVLDKRFKA